MKINNEIWSASFASHIGRDHHSSFENCQDYCSSHKWTHQGQDYLFGIVCDGCGGAIESCNEVGSRLVVSSAISYAPFASLNIDNFSQFLFDYLKTYISQSIDTMSLHSGHGPERNYLIQKFWLCTILGFIITPEKGMIFSCGDGCYQLNDDFVEIKQNNNPSYIAYSCVKESVPAILVPDKFNVINFNPLEINRLMVASDGFVSYNINALKNWKRKYPEKTLPEVYNNQWNKKGSFGLNKWMNVLFNCGYFTDDCSIITVEKNAD